MFRPEDCENVCVLTDVVGQSRGENYLSTTVYIAV